MTEDQIRTTTVGEPTPVPGGRVLHVDYDPEWPRQFRREAERICAALGDQVLRIEHTGSTSVPGLPAKPIIDMVLVVAEPADEPAYFPALEDAGYLLRIREPDWYQHRVFVKRVDEGSDIDVNLHVYPAGCPEIDRVLVFRDRLRDNPSDRELYASTKRALAQREWQYMQNYADAKTAVIEEIIERAWADRS